MSWSQAISTNLVTRNAQIVAKTQGGAHSNNVTVSLNPIVLLRVGKYALKLNEITIEHSARANHQTFQSPKARTRPLP